MGGKSRKTGGVSKALIDRIKSGGSLAPAKSAAPTKSPSRDPFSLGLGKK